MFYISEYIYTRIPCSRTQIIGQIPSKNTCIIILNIQAPIYIYETAVDVDLQCPLLGLFGLLYTTPQYNISIYYSIAVQSDVGRVYIIRISCKFASHYEPSSSSYIRPLAPAARDQIDCRFTVSTRRLSDFFHYRSTMLFVLHADNLDAVVACHAQNVRLRRTIKTKDKTI